MYVDMTSRSLFHLIFYFGEPGVGVAVQVPVRTNELLSYSVPVRTTNCRKKIEEKERSKTENNKTENNINYNHLWVPLRNLVELVL